MKNTTDRNAAPAAHAAGAAAISLEQLSAFADGQLQGEEWARTLDGACRDAELRAAWQTYHLVGDVLRSGRHAPCSDSTAFVARLQQRLAAEAVDAAMPAPRPAPVPQPDAFVRRTTVHAANEPVFRWKMVAGVASVAAAAAIGWAWVGAGIEGAPAGAQLALREAPAGAASAVVAVSNAPSATTQARALVGGVPQIMLRDPRLDELLEAHQQAVGASQMPSGFLRNATFDGGAR